MAVVPLHQPKNADRADHTELAELLYRADHFLSHDGEFWRYTERGIWERVAKETVQRDVQALCRRMGQAASASLVNGVVSMAHGVYYRDVEWDATDRRAVAVRGGVLVYRSGCWVLTPYRPEDYRRVCLPLEYDPKAECPRFTAFMQQTFAGAEDANERIVALVEMLGLSLTATTEFERGILLVGSGANGKSVLLRLLADMLGSYASGVNPAEFENRFQRGSLDGKLVNITTELPEGTVLPDGAIKAIISGEPCTVERKFQDPFVLRPTAKIWIATNHLPSVRDFSPALYRRFTILRFPNVVPEADRDTGLSEKLRAELPGILNVLLQALGRVYERGLLTTPPSSLAEIENWRRDADQVLSFLEEEMIREADARIASSDAYQLYQAWAREAGIQRTVNRKNFTTRVEGLGWATAAKGSGGQRMLFGIRQRLAGDI
ncbi:MAG: DNA primase family protein [Acidithiobacillus sp.]|uniref:DNA primase family protein n=1 Tax=Acidithiobacillus sp. TaxID=1872118 RepID=UPI003CFCEB84